MRTAPDAKSVFASEMPTSKTALIYLRVSTSRQASKGDETEGYSIPVQRAACQRKARELDASIVEEFVDAGASARSADRPALQAMLARLKLGAVDYVIVHKVDRLARDRADDVTIMLAIHQAGAVLVSTSEAIDASPAGTLLHGIMASISEFYSKNLSQEAKKGLHEKARRGGTPSYAPLGYLNGRARRDGEEIKTIIIDPDRAPHIQWAFNTYATAQWSIAELTEELDRRGMRSRQTRKFPGAPLKRASVHRLLSNPYYVGRIRYDGIEYQGKHPRLIDDATFEAVQSILASRRLAGDRSWRHRQYLKGSVFCGRCGERLGFGHSTGKTGTTYPYFFCLGRHRARNDCDLPYLHFEKVDTALLEAWRDVRFRPALVEMVSAEVERQFDQMEQEDARTLDTQRRRIAAL